MYHGLRGDGRPCLGELRQKKVAIIIKIRFFLKLRTMSEIKCKRAISQRVPLKLSKLTHHQIYFFRSDIVWTDCHERRLRGDWGHGPPKHLRSVVEVATPPTLLAIIRGVFERVASPVLGG